MSRRTFSGRTVNCAERRLFAYYFQAFASAYMQIWLLKTGLSNARLQQLILWKTIVIQKCLARHIVDRVARNQ